MTYRQLSTFLKVATAVGAPLAANVIFSVLEANQSFNSAFFQNYNDCYQQYTNTSLVLLENPSRESLFNPCEGIDCYKSLFLPITTGVTMFAMGAGIMMMSVQAFSMLRENDIRKLWKFGTSILLLLSAGVNPFIFFALARLSQSSGGEYGCYVGALDAHNTIANRNPANESEIDEYYNPGIYIVCVITACLIQAGKLIDTTYRELINTILARSHESNVPRDNANLNNFVRLEEVVTPEEVQENDDIPPVIERPSRCTIS